MTKNELETIDADQLTKVPGGSDVPGGFNFPGGVPAIEVHDPRGELIEMGKTWKQKPLGAGGYWSSSRPGGTAGR